MDTGAFLTKLEMVTTSDHSSVVSMNLFVALLCACIVIGHLLEENRWMNESITALAIVSLCFYIYIYIHIHTHTDTYMNIYAVLEFWGQLWILNRLSRIMCLTKVYVLMWVVDIHTYTYNNDNNNKGSVLKLWGAQETMQDWNYVGIYVNVYV